MQKSDPITPATVSGVLKINHFTQHLIQIRPLLFELPVPCSHRLTAPVPCSHRLTAQVPCSQRLTAQVPCSHRLTAPVPCSQRLTAPVQVPCSHRLTAQSPHLVKGNQKVIYYFSSTSPVSTLWRCKSAPTT